MYNRFLKSSALSIFLIVLISCSSSSPKMELHSSQPTDEKSDWLILARNNQRQNFSLKNINPPLKVVWKKRIKSVVIDHPLATGDIILAPTKDGMIRQIDYSTGEEKSHNRIGPGMDCSPIIINNFLYAGISVGEKTILGIDLTDGKSRIQVNYSPVQSTPLHWNDRLYFGTNIGFFFCIDAGSGGEIWRYEAKGAVMSSAALKNESIFFADEKGWLHCLNAKTGDKIWNRQLEGNIYSHPVIEGDNVFVGTNNGQFYAIDFSDGRIAWRKKLKGAIYSSPSIFENMLYIGTNGHQITAIEQNSGEIGWTFNAKGIINTMPLTSPNYVYVSSWDNNLYILDRRTGQLEFKYEFDRPLKSSPIIYRDLLLVHVSNRHLYALANDALAENWGNEE